MQMSLITDFKADSVGKESYPDLDAQARIAFNADYDGLGHEVFNVNEINCFDTSKGKMNHLFGLYGLSKGLWEVTFTDSRVTFWTPVLLSPFGKKPKTKTGKATAGHLLYHSIGALTTSVIDSRPMVSFSCMREDGTRSDIAVEADALTIQRLVTEAHKRISRYLEKNNMRCDTEELIEEWDEYLSKLDFDSKFELIVIVPSTGISIVKNT